MRQHAKSTKATLVKESGEEEDDASILTCAHAGVHEVVRAVVPDLEDPQDDRLAIVIYYDSTFMNKACCLSRICMDVLNHEDE